MGETQAGLQFIPDEVAAAAAKVEALREAGAPALERAHATKLLRAAEREAGITADGEPFAESATAAVGSLRDAIDAKCRSCIVDEEAAGSAAVQVELCACYECPLWLVRPVRAGDRSFYSRPVIEEMGLSAEEARFRYEHPRERPAEQAA